MDIEDTMRFILEMQAKHDAAMARHEAAIQKHDEEIAENRRQIQANTGMIRQLVDVSLSLARSIEESNASLQASIRELRGAQAATDYKLNALIETVDKLVRRNGGSRT